MNLLVNSAASSNQTEFLIRSRSSIIFFIESFDFGLDNLRVSSHHIPTFLHFMAIAYPVSILLVDFLDTFINSLFLLYKHFLHKLVFKYFWVIGVCVFFGFAEDARLPIFDIIDQFAVVFDIIQSLEFVLYCIYQVFSLSILSVIGASVLSF